MSEVDLAAMADSAKTHREESPLTPIQQVNSCLKACKFGRFNIRLLSVTLVGFVSGVAVSNTTSYLLPSAECDLHMTLLQKGILNAMPYLGMLFSSVLAGFLTDTFGRKIFLMIGFGGMFVFTVIAGTSQTYDVLVTAKFFEGLLFASSFSAAVTLSAEFCHNDIRDRIIILQSSFLALAQVIIAGIAWAVLIQDWKYTMFGGFIGVAIFCYQTILTIFTRLLQKEGNVFRAYAFPFLRHALQPKRLDGFSFIDVVRFVLIVLNTWNFYLYIMSLWSLASFLMYSYLPESPKYLVMQKEYVKAREIFINIYKENTGKSADTYPYKDIWTNEIREESDRTSESKKLSSFSQQIVVGLHNIKPMYKKPLVKYLGVICLINFMTMASYNIIRLWFPQVSTVVEHYQSDDQDLCTMLDSYTEDLKLRQLNTSSETQCVPTRSGAETYINSMIIGGMSIVPIIMTGMLVNRIGKNNLVILGYLTFAGATLGMRWANTKTAVVALFAVNVCVGQTHRSLIQAIVIEFFSTSTRSLALSIMMMLGRTGALLGNVAFPILLNISCELPFFLISGIMFSLVFVGFFLPTKKQVKTGTVMIKENNKGLETINDVRSGDETYINSIIIGSISMIPYLVTGLIVNRVGRKPLIVLAGIIFAGATLGMRWANTKVSVVSLFAADICFGQTIISMNQAIIVEFFPTTTRSLAISTTMMLGRIGTLLGNVAFPMLLSVKCELPFYLLSVLMLVVVSLAFLLPMRKK